MAVGKGRDCVNFISVRKFAWMGGRIYNAWVVGRRHLDLKPIIVDFGLA